MMMMRQMTPPEPPFNEEMAQVRAQQARVQIPKRRGADMKARSAVPTNLTKSIKNRDGRAQVSKQVWG
jgi:hypothetical protein